MDGWVTIPLNFKKERGEKEKKKKVVPLPQCTEGKNLKRGDQVLPQIASNIITQKAKKESNSPAFPHGKKQNKKAIVGFASR